MTCPGIDKKIDDTTPDCCPAGVGRDAIPTGIFPGTVGTPLRVEPLLPGIRPRVTPPGIFLGTAGSPLRIAAAQLSLV